MLIGLLCSLGMNVYKLEHLIRKRMQLEEETSKRTLKSSIEIMMMTTVDLKTFQKQMNTVMLDLVRDLLDLVILRSTLDYIRL
jgi:hypothetical protein